MKEMLWREMIMTGMTLRAAAAGMLRKAVRGCGEFLADEDGVGVIEVVLILVVLIGLVAVFKTQINQLLTRIFESISSMSDDIL